MIGKHYKAHKDNVIDLFNNYKIKRGDTNDGVKINFLENRVESLKNGKFTLAIAGEVKAGKSTFINALLGTELLPSDVLQSSSTIVEIFKSETPSLRVKYADGTIESISDELTSLGINAKARLHEICKIHDEYREIPTPLIDDCIIASADVLKVDEDFIRQLEQKSSEQLQGKHKVIEKFISERTKDKIPVEIDFGYPLKWEFDELRIVDSPGVNATGGVQNVSFQFFEQADAILFVHQIKPIESESFRKFVNSTISNRSRETLFLILTHAGLYSNDDVDRLHKEANRLYHNIIPENRILVVDSLLKLIHCDLNNGISVKEIQKSNNKKKILYEYLEQAEKEERDLIDIVYEGSRFEKMFAAVDEFSMKAPNLQLQEILRKIKEGYEEQENLYTEKTERLEKKKVNPQQFEEEINRINAALEKYKLLTRETREDLESNYSGRHSSWQKDIDTLKTKYITLIAESNNIEITRKNTLDALNDVEKKIDDFSMELTKNLTKALDEAGKQFKSEYQISTPKMIDLQALEENAKAKAFHKEAIYEDKIDGTKTILGATGAALAVAGIIATLTTGPFGFLAYLGIASAGAAAGAGGAKAFKKKIQVGTRDVFDEKKHLEEYRHQCSNELSSIINIIPNKSKEILNTYLNDFSKEMDSVISDRQEALEAEKTKKQSNEDIIIEIKELDRKKKDIQPEKLRCIEVLEDIK